MRQEERRKIEIFNLSSKINGTKHYYFTTLVMRGRGRNRKGAKSAKE